MPEVPDDASNDSCVTMTHYARSGQNRSWIEKHLNCSHFNPNHMDRYPNLTAVLSAASFDVVAEHVDCERF